VNGASSDARLGDPGAGAGVVVTGFARASRLFNPAVSKESARFVSFGVSPSPPNGKEEDEHETSPRIHTAPFPEDLARTASANRGE
jgi:hypothetical protein